MPHLERFFLYNRLLLAYTSSWVTLRASTATPAFRLAFLFCVPIASPNIFMLQGQVFMGSIDALFFRG
jgi:hypothetical protein